MRVVCAWCQHEGRSPLLRVAEPFDDPSETHGICARHQQALFETFSSASFPSTRWLFIVSATEPDAYHHLASVMDGVPGVTVIVDRRRGERRSGGAAPAEERRRAERRVRRPEATGLGYVLVRFTARETPAQPDGPLSKNPGPEGTSPGDRVVRS